MRRFKKLISCLLMFTLVFTAALPALAAGTQPLSVQTDTLKETVSNRFYQLVDRLIRILGRVLNTLIPGLNWTGKIPAMKDYTAENFYPGKASFDTAPADNARWRMGFGEASFLTDIDPLDGSFYIAGKIGFTEGNVPVAVADDQGVNTFALSDGVTTVTFSSIDGFGLTRGDVLEVRRRLADFAAEHGIDAINVSSIHQHSCIDTLGLGAPILPAVLRNPTDILLGGKHLVTGKTDAFMEAFYTAVTESVIGAVESLTPGALYYGAADISEHINDKRDPQSFDPNFNRLRFVPDNGGRQIVVGQTCIHPVTVSGDSHVLSADYPYYVERYVNEHMNADFVFLQGAELAISSHAGTFSYDPADGATARAEAMGRTLGEKLCAITEETEIEPLLNVAFTEVTVPVDNPIHTVAGREGLLSSVFVRDGLGYSVITELGYMELGAAIGVVLAPGEIEPAILWGGAPAAADTWTGEGWDYAPWQQECGAEKLLCFGLCNDQIGYILCDNDYRSMLTENEEVNAASQHAGSILSEAFAALIAKVK